MALNCLGLICFFIRTMFPLINWSQLCFIVFLSVWPLQLSACSWGQTSEVCNIYRPFYEYLLHYMLSTFSMRHCCCLLYSLLHSTYACGLLYYKRNHLHVVRLKLFYTLPLNTAGPFWLKSTFLSSLENISIMTIWFLTHITVVAL